jgi:DNA-binding beta-propeller fold protein YncE
MLAHSSLIDARMLARVCDPLRHSRSLLIQGGASTTGAVTIGTNSALISAPQGIVFVPATSSSSLATLVLANGNANLLAITVPAQGSGGIPVVSVFATSSYFITPQGLTYYNSQFYVTDSTNNSVLVVSASGASVTLLSASSLFSSPQGIALYNGLFYVANANTNTLVTVNPATTGANAGVTTLVSNSTLLNSPQGVVVYASVLYIVNSGDNILTYDSSKPSAELGIFSASNLFSNGQGIVYSSLVGAFIVGNLAGSNILTVAVGSGAVAVVATISSPYDMNTGVYYLPSQVRVLSSSVSITLPPSLLVLNAHTVLNITASPLLATPSRSVTLAATTDASFNAPYDMVVVGVDMYVTNYAGNSISRIRNGAVVNVFTSSVTGLCNNPAGIVAGLSNAGNGGVATTVVFASSGSNQLVSLTLASGVFAVFSTSGLYINPLGVAYDPVSGYYYVANSGDNNIVRVDPTTGAASVWIKSPYLSSPQSLAFDMNGNGYIVNKGNTNLVVVSSSGSSTTAANAAYSSLIPLSHQKFTLPSSIARPRSIIVGPNNRPIADGFVTLFISDVTLMTVWNVTVSFPVAATSAAQINSAAWSNVVALAIFAVAAIVAI